MFMHDMHTHSHTHTHTHTHERTRTWIAVFAFILPEDRGAFSPPNLHSKFSLNKERRWERGVTLMTSDRACSWT